MDPTVFVHERALCETDLVGPRTRIWAFAHLTPGAKVGADCNICDHVYIEEGATLGDQVTVKNNVMLWEGVTLEDQVFIGPNAVFTNDLRPRVVRDPGDEFVPIPTHVKRGASVGANATIVCGTTIGERSFVAAGAVVTKDVAPHALVAGNPAKRIGWICECGRTLPEDLGCSCG
ncbi:MAG: acyltransferase, partial [Acidimicrobiia bacterium]